MGDLLRGFIGLLLQFILGFLFIAFLLAFAFTNQLWLFILSIMCLALMGAIKYWLGRIVRFK